MRFTCLKRRKLNAAAIVVMALVSIWIFLREPEEYGSHSNKLPVEIERRVWLHPTPKIRTDTVPMKVEHLKKVFGSRKNNIYLKTKDKSVFGDVKNVNKLETRRGGKAVVQVSLQSRNTRVRNIFAKLYNLHILLYLTDFIYLDFHTM